MSELSPAIERSKAVICRNLFNDPSDLLRVNPVRWVAWTMPGFQSIISGYDG